MRQPALYHIKFRLSVMLVVQDICVRRAQRSNSSDHICHKSVMRVMYDIHVIHVMMKQTFYSFKRCYGGFECYTGYAC